MVVTPFIFGNPLKFGSDSCHNTKGKPTFLHREREYPKPHVNHTTHYMHNYREGPPLGPARAGALPWWVVEWRPHDGGFPPWSRPGVNSNVIGTNYFTTFLQNVDVSNLLWIILKIHTIFFFIKKLQTTNVISDYW